MVYRMSKKHLLKKTKRDFMNWVNQQDDTFWFDLVTTPFTADTQIARLRRLYIKAFNDKNLRQLKGNGIQNGTNTRNYRSIEGT